MSANASPSHYTEDAFVSDANFKVEINQKMKVPEKISLSNDSNGELRNSWVRDNFNMQVPEKLFVVGQDQYIGARAPPREIAYDNSLLATEGYTTELPRVATPPRTLTLDKYPFPGVEKYEQHEPEPEDQLPVFKPKAKVQLNLNDSLYSVHSLRESTPPLGGSSNDSLTTAEEVIHLRRQLAKLNRRVMALELENINRVQKEKIVVGCGVAYFLLKLIIWMSKD
ncbi:transport and golgi organization 11 [Rhynchophorus ferrugineus]|uniref:Mff-like domain-containing protein n=1 Tax=Rhynchophorus ferrugineus TaxID=354439 RepID=A0A834HY93_RHYFE|nr:hypothetical protein GWI33_017603 [Rhynchophorus ferrugineus]